MTCITTITPVCTIVKLKKDVLKLLDNVNRKVTIMRNDNQTQEVYGIHCDSDEWAKETAKICGNHVVREGWFLMTDRKLEKKSMSSQEVEKLCKCLPHIEKTTSSEEFTDFDWDQWLGAINQEKEECMC